ncbi:hypothetical protein CYMTET_16670 [Cymbomonas tetramitiformis]|uniref:Uncharacterized protein n=1 Tax=Cymbomonas tetramitiformis TaxID=36881 RepID=A0AAE0GC17_9CHLO|nr:hypothetical protein CYMTET_16670 [Cymbomonas tetramitiformis]
MVVQRLPFGQALQSGRRMSELPSSSSISASRAQGTFRRGRSPSSPEVGKHIKFDGRYLHGVPAEALAPASAPYTRVTFLVNIWLNHRPVDVPVFPDHLLAKVGNLDLPLSSKVADRVPQIEVCSKTEGGGDELSFTVCQSRDQEHTLRTRLPLKELAAKKLATAEIMYTVVGALHLSSAPE